MAIKIGHARMDENGKATGGQSGDSTTQEVRVQSWYSKSWQYYLECIDENIANIAATYMEQICANNMVGYDQSARLTLYNQLKVHRDVSKLTPCECDCSSLVACCYIMAGLNISPACTTRNLRSALLATGKFKAYSDSEYLTSDKYAKRGGLYLREGSHVIMALENGSAHYINTTAIKGVDVSSYQGKINWEQVKASGVRFAILRSTLKSGNPDVKFAEYLKGCDDNGITVSVYKYSYSLTEEQAIVEANSVISLLNGRKCKIWLDLEDKSQVILGKAGIEKIAMAFINTCVNYGYEVGIYCNLNWHKNYISDSLKKYDVWIARYGSNNGEIDDKYKPNVGEAMWQYTSKGRIAGITGNVDVNVLYDESALILTTTPTTTSITTAVTANMLNIRSNPGTKNKIVGVYKKGDIITILEHKDGWCRTSEGWCSIKYVDTPIGVVNCNKLHLRANHGTNYESLKILTLNTNMRILRKEGGWYLTDLGGWVSAKYITLQ